MTIPYNYAPPIEPQRIRADNVRGVLDRDAHKILPEAICRLHVAEMIHKPQGNLGNLRRKRLYLDSVKLSDGNLEQLRDIEKKQVVDGG